MHTLVHYDNVSSMIETEKPIEPVYCLYSNTMCQTARTFLEGFPGRVLYAVKVNPDPQVLKCLWEAGVRYFDTASLGEVELIKSLFPDAVCYFMGPARLKNAARQAYTKYGIRHFVVDHMSALDILQEEVPVEECMIFARMATPSKYTTFDLSSKFGATSEMTIELLRAIEKAGAKPSLAFNVGSLVLQPEAYSEALAEAVDVLDRADVIVSELDIGGGYPVQYGGIEVKHVTEFFTIIEQTRKRLRLTSDILLLGEPGRALVADGMSLVTQVILRKGDQLYLNDGIYGSLTKLQAVFPTRTFRADGIPLSTQSAKFRLYGPTCDSTDVMPETYDLPDDIAPGDWIEIGMVGAYSLARRTHFNGFYPERMVNINGEDALLVK